MHTPATPCALLTLLDSSLRWNDEGQGYPRDASTPLRFAQHDSIPPASPECRGHRLRGPCLRRNDGVGRSLTCTPHTKGPHPRPLSQWERGAGSPRDASTPLRSAQHDSIPPASPGVSGVQDARFLPSQERRGRARPHPRPAHEGPSPPAPLPVGEGSGQPERCFDSVVPAEAGTSQPPHQAHALDSLSSQTKCNTRLGCCHGIQTAHH